MIQNRRQPRALALVEVLVLLALLGMLLALLLPALQRVREAAKQTRCDNNLRQMVFGFQRHQETHECLPSGGGNRTEDRRMTRLGPTSYDQQTWGWGYQILPFIGHEALWRNEDDFMVAGTPMPVYSCPTLRPPTAFAYTETGIWRYQRPPRQRFMMDYAGCGGSSGTFLSFARPSDGLLTPSGTGPVSLAEIPDGAANTLLLGEKYLDVNAVRLHPCFNDNAGWVAGWDSNTICLGKETPRRNDESGCTPGFVFGSSHPAGMQSAFGDGSVRTLAYDVDPDVWQAITSLSSAGSARLP